MNSADQKTTILFYSEANHESVSVRISNIDPPIDRGQDTELMCRLTDTAIHF